MQTVQKLAELWASMAAMYGHAWTSSYGSAPIDERGELTRTGRIWAEVLNGISLDGVRRATRVVQRSGREWPPSAPELRAIALGVPSLERVERELRGELDESDFGFAVRKRLDSWAHSQASVADAQRLVHAAYRQTKHAVLNGEPLLARPPALPAPSPKPQPTAEQIARARLIQQQLAIQWGCRGEA